jgi:hypothetical protein
MRFLFLAFLIMPQFIFAQKIKTRTQYASHAIDDSIATKVMEEIQYYTTDSLLQQEESYSNNELNAIEIYHYNANNTIKNTLHYDVNNNTKQLDSAQVIDNNYDYLPNNAVKKTITQFGSEPSISNYVTDINGRKISDNYIYTLDAKKRLQERYRKNNDKKTARIEKFYYLPNNKLQAVKIFLGKKPIAVTTYFYNAQNQLAKEVTKTFKGKKSTSDAIYYQYQNNLLSKEISVIVGQDDTVVEYSYTFYE